MNKVLHVLVYVFLVLAGAGLYFELQLNAKRAELCDRNELQEEYFVKIASTIEEAEPDKSLATAEAMKDNSPVEAKIVDVPENINVLDEYKAELEQKNLKCYNWDNMSIREQLRKVYVLDGEGKPVMNGNKPLDRGPGTERELLDKLFKSASTQQARLNTTRNELTVLRGVIDGLVNEINKMKPEARQDKVTIEELEDKVGKLEGEKTDLEGQVTRFKGQVDELNGEITSLKDSVQAKEDELGMANEELEKAKKLTKQLQEMLARSLQTPGKGGVANAVVSQLPFGDKGKVIRVDNECLFAIIEFTPEAIKELKGENGNDPLPHLELGLRRAGFTGEAGEFIGRVTLRQEIKGKPYVVADILPEWAQADIQIGDIIFAD